MDALDTQADLLTHRLNWVVLGDADTETAETVRMVIDYVNEVVDEQRPEAERFSHVGGGVELSVPLSNKEGVDQMVMRQTNARMHRTLDAFFESHSSLFPTQPAPLGKLTAYCRWKTGARNNS